MANVQESSAKPVSCIYFDEHGIETLHAQTVNRLEIERSTTLEKAVAGKAGATARLKNLLLKALGGPEFEITGEVSGSRKRTEQSKEAYAVEQKLADLMAALQRVGKPVWFSDLGEASRYVDSSQTSAFVRIDDTFNAPQFYSGNGSTSVNNEGYLILEKCRAGEYEYRDDYYKLKKPSRLVTISASILKMPTSSRGMAPSGHDAIFFRGFGGREIPLGLFGSMTATPKYFQIKPYAIWR
jgi:hypothetical protein